MVQEARGVEIADARVQSERKQQLHVAGSEMLARIFGRDVPRRHVQQASGRWASMYRHARDEQRSWEVLQELRGS